MTHLMEEYPSVELPAEIKKRICQTFYQKQRFDANLVARSQARNKAVNKVIFPMFEYSSGHSINLCFQMAKMQQVMMSCYL